MKTTTVGAFEAKTHLSAILEEVRQGGTFHITRRGRPVAELRPLDDRGRRTGPPVQAAGDGRISIGPPQKTLWY